ncbi:dihydropteroate synthase [Chamaesiphon polymorphus]|uniref:Dihydropteroate synthase n=1 Tax=Chamaesiphon polymorphus CCALA 037 TaxID=2107692 RepID=A0A2T1GL69_9CYAN|nr:dihydropteroate synthase [Chamaesiphon polymorphus]PSB58544.1 dihydropteroate synthase [Chamaesiphon polymorphus CCALA 037]
MSKLLTIRGKNFEWGSRTYIMGVLNVTPDSFSDGGRFATVDAAIAQAVQMVSSGVDIIDIGGESAKPGATPVDEVTELARVIPVIERIRQHPDLQSIPISIDTTKANVARSTIAAGADIINDVSGGQFDDRMFETVAQLVVPYVMMHMRGTPATMQQLTDYEDVVGEILAFFETQIDRAVKSGIDRAKIILDPGIGFAKQYQQSIEIIRHLDRFDCLDLPLLVGVSRKSFIGKILDQPDPSQRLWGTSAACCAAIARGADILRVHDVAEMVDVSRVADIMFRH